MTYFHHAVLREDDRTAPLRSSDEPGERMMGVDDVVATQDEPHPEAWKRREIAPASTVSVDLQNVDLDPGGTKRLDLITDERSVPRVSCARIHVGDHERPQRAGAGPEAAHAGAMTLVERSEQPSQDKPETCFSVQSVTALSRQFHLR